MIEAVNAVVSNSPLLRSVAEQTSTTQVLSANPSKTQVAATAAPYLSPHVEYEGGTPVFIVRDASTGETLSQFPSKSQIMAYTKAAQVSEQVAAQTTSGVDTTTTTAGTDVAKSTIDFKDVRQAVKQPSEQVVPQTEPSGTLGSTDSAKYSTVSRVDTQA